MDNNTSEALAKVDIVQSSNSLALASDFNMVRAKSIFLRGGIEALKGIPIFGIAVGAIDGMSQKLSDLAAEDRLIELERQLTDLKERLNQIEERREFDMQEMMRDAVYLTELQCSLSTDINKRELLKRAYSRKYDKSFSIELTCYYIEIVKKFSDLSTELMLSLLSGCIIYRNESAVLFNYKWNGNKIDILEEDKSQTLRKFNNELDRNLFEEQLKIIEKCSLNNVDLFKLVHSSEAHHYIFNDSFLKGKLQTKWQALVPTTECRSFLRFLQPFNN